MTHAVTHAVTHSRILFLGAAIVIATLAAYTPALRGEFLWDDDAHVSANPYVRSPSGLGTLLTSPAEAMPARQWYPVTMFAFWLEYRLWGDDTLGYHIVNVLLHATSALLLWRLLSRLAVPGAWFAAAVFALHPVHVESVAWITELKNTLSGVFYFLAFLAWVRWEESRHDGAGTGKAGWWAGAFVLYLLAMGAKVTAATLPGAFCLAYYWRRGRLGWSGIAPAIPFFIAGIAIGIGYARSEMTDVGATGEAWSLGGAERLLLAGRAWWFYCSKVVLPGQHAFFYQRWDIDATAPEQWLWPIAAITVLALLWWKRERLGRGPLVALLYFTGTALPALGFLNVYPFRYSFVADHFQYLASVGTIALVAAAGARAATRATLSRHVTVAVTVLVLAGLGAITWRQCHAFRSSEALWRDTIAENPSWGAFNQLGNIESAQGRHAEALALYQQAAAIEPRSHEVWGNIGRLLLHFQRLQDANEAFQKSFDINPGYAKAVHGLALVRTRLGDYAHAIPMYQELIAQDPDNADFHSGLGKAYLGAGDLERAVAACRRALELGPGHAEAKTNLGAALAQMGRLDEGLALIEEVVRDAPETPNVYTNLGAVQGMRGRFAEAVSAYRIAVRMEPRNRRAWVGLLTALLDSDDLEGAQLEAMRARLHRIRLTKDIEERLGPEYEATHDESGTNDGEE